MRRTLLNDDVGGVHHRQHDNSMGDTSYHDEKQNTITLLSHNHMQLYDTAMRTTTECTLYTHNKINKHERGMIMVAVATTTPDSIVPTRFYLQAVIFFLLLDHR